MRKDLPICLLGIAIVTQPASAQTRPGTPPPAVTAIRSRCDILAADYRRYEQNLADRFASGIGDNSAPRATLHEMENANDLSAAALTVQFMRDNRCTLPTRAPTEATYAASALACASARLGQRGTEEPPACDRSTWQRVDSH